MRGWTIQDSIELYNVRNWGRDFFRINDKGNVEVTPSGPRNGAVDLKVLVDDLVRRGIQPPILLRFPDILEYRVRSIANAFGKAIDADDYQGVYRGVYPIKVNQQQISLRM